MDLPDPGAIFRSIPIDWLILGGLAFVGGFEFIRDGSRRSAALALALPIALLLFLALGEAAVLGSITDGMETAYAQALFFGALVVIAYILVLRVGLSYGGARSQPIQAAVAGVALTIIALCIWLQTPALDTLWHFGAQVQSLFAEQYRFWWLLGAYIALAFARTR